MAQTMKALVKKEATKGIWMEQVPLPEIGPNDVLIKLEKTAICGTDLHIYKWDEWSQRVIKPGLVIGHEFVGRIVDMGPGVRGYQVGQRVSAEGHIVCGYCRNCRAGKQHLCPHTIGIGVTLEGFDEIGARQAIAVDAQEAATEFLVDASERILDQIFACRSDHGDVLLLGSEENDVIGRHQDQSATLADAEEAAGATRQ